VSIYNRDEILPEWESVPWKLSGTAENEQEQGFHERTLKNIVWQNIDWNNFPEAGIFGRFTPWLQERDVSYFATHDDEQLLLIDNIWNGWPDPPRWGLVSQPIGVEDAPWQHWGHFPDLPKAWRLPDQAKND